MSTYNTSDMKPGVKVLFDAFQTVEADPDLYAKTLREVIAHLANAHRFPLSDADKIKVGEAALWLKEQDTCKVLLWNGIPLLVTPPIFINAKIVQTDPGARGDTVTGGSKPAKLETGAVVKVPLFLNEGEIIKVDTRTGEYLNRAGK